MKTTEIEKQLITKSQKEIKELVNELENHILLWIEKQKMSTKTSREHLSLRLKQNDGDKNYVYCTSMNSFGVVLNRAFRDAFLEKMVSIKTKNLLDKINLL
jgi:hypothetical protein